MATYAFFAITFFSDINFVFKFYSAKRRTKGLKLCEKKDRTPYSFRRKRSFIEKETVLVRTVRALAQSKKLCAVRDVQCNTKESP